MNYYNDLDPAVCAWTEELVARKLIPDGKVDCRSITEITPEDLYGFTQCHFFNGISGWALALKTAGWDQRRPVWCASLPCQPFSIAGKRRGKEDERHLWPVFAELVRKCKPATIFGEQVASKDGRGWLAGVFADLENMGYSRAGADLCAAGVAAPHIRQRLYWVVNARCQCYERWGDIGELAGAGCTAESEARKRQWCGNADCYCRTTRGMADPVQPRLEGHSRHGGIGCQPGWIRAPEAGSVAKSCAIGGLGNTTGDQQRRNGQPGEIGGRFEPVGGSGAWDDARIIPCRDGKQRRIPVESGLFPLADAGQYLVPGVARRRTVRPMLLRGAGNAIVPEVAATFITAFLEATK